MLINFREAWRPTTLRDVALDDGVRRQLLHRISEGDPGDLLLVGRPETDVRRIAALYLDQFEDVAVRRPHELGRTGDWSESARRFLRVIPMIGSHVLLVDHLDRLGSGTARDLLRLLRSYRLGRVVATASRVTDVAPDLLEHLVEVDVPRAPTEERIRVLLDVASEAGLELDADAVRPWVVQPMSIARTLSAMDAMYARTGSVTPSLSSDPRLLNLSESSGDRAEAIPWELAPVLARNHLTLLYGAPKQAGKSTFARHLAAAKSRGQEFLGHRLKRGRALWVGPDEHGPDVVRELRAIGADMKKIELWKSRMVDFQQVAWLVAGHDFEIVILDTLPRIAHVRSENDNSGWTEWANYAMPMIQDSGAAWLAIHHTRKGGGRGGEDVRGASAIYGFVDVAVHLEPFGNHRARRRLSVVGSRLKTADPTYYELRDDRLELLNEDQLRSSRPESDPADTVLEVVGTEPMEQDEILDALASAGYDVASSTLYAWLDSLVERGELECEGGTRGSPRRWWVPSAEQVEPEFVSSDTETRV